MAPGRLAAIITVMTEMDLKNSDNIISGGRPDLEALRREASDDTITSKERDEAFEKWNEDTSPKSSLKAAKLRANTVCRVEEGETQVAWGSNFTAKEIANPELKAEFPEENAPKKILVLDGEFTDEDEIKSLLSSKRANRI